MGKEIHYSLKREIRAFENPEVPLLLSIVIPVKDEALHIEDLIRRVIENHNSYPYEIIVVDDGSTDKTKEIALRAGAVVVSHPRNLGKGAAMSSGIKKATGHIIVFLDGDGAHDPQDISRVILPILQGKADLVIGSRSLPESKVRNFPVVRKICNDLASLIISTIIYFCIPITLKVGQRFKAIGAQQLRVKPTRISDCTSGFRAITKQTWQKLNLTSMGFQIETEMIYEAARNGLTIREVPISCKWDNRLSHLFVLKDGLSTLRLLATKLANDIKSCDRNAKKI